MADNDSTASTKTCTKCGETKPIEDFRLAEKGYRPGHRRSHCRPCDRAADRQRRQQNPERAAMLKRKSYAAHKETSAAYSKAWKAANAVAWAAYMKAWKAAHVKEMAAYNHGWAQDNKLSSAHRQAQRRARKQALPDTFTYEEEQFCRQSFHYTCAYCGREEGFQWILAMDHFVPVSALDCPGTVATNMLPACHGIGGCNISKKHRDPHTWLLRKFGKRKTAIILKKINAYFAAVRTRFSID